MKIRKAVIPAAGLGTRLLPATKAVPKEMLPLADIPTIQYIVEEAVESGIEHVIIITSRGKRSIEDHFDCIPELEQELERKGDKKTLDMLHRITDMVQISFTRQHSPRGLGHAILQAKDLVGNEPFGVLLGDDLISGAKPGLKQLIDVYDERKGSVLAVMHVPGEQISRYGAIKSEKLAPGVHQVNHLVEKPPFAEAPSDLAVIGRYVLSPKIFEILEKTPAGVGGEIQLTDALHQLLKHESIYACEFEGVRYDTGDKVGWLATSIEYALKRPDLAPGLKAYLRTLKLDD